MALTDEKPVCGRCFKETPDEELLEAPCYDKPELLKGEPIGMYHCGQCLAMVVAGFKHPKICKDCVEEVRI